MRFRVVLQQLACKDLEGSYRWIAQHAPGPANNWLRRFQDALQTLAHNPQRCPLAHENSRVTVELREFLFGKKPNTYRVLFVIDSQIVRILRIRRGQQQFLSGPQIEDALDPELD